MRGDAIFAAVAIAANVFCLVYPCVLIERLRNEATAQIEAVCEEQEQVLNDLQEKLDAGYAVEYTGNGTIPEGMSAEMLCASYALVGVNDTRNIIYVKEQSDDDDFHHTSYYPVITSFFLSK